MSIKLVLTNWSMDLEQVTVTAMEEAMAGEGDTFQVFIPEGGRDAWKRITVYKRHVVMYYRYDSPKALGREDRKASVKPGRLNLQP